jgi:hypothetical protein
VQLKEIVAMSNSNNDPSYQHFDSDTQGVESEPAVPDCLESKGNRFSIEEIEAEIRWFFENALEGGSSHR